MIERARRNVFIIDWWRPPKVTEISIDTYFEVSILKNNTLEKALKSTVRLYLHALDRLTPHAFNMLPGSNI